MDLVEFVVEATLHIGGSRRELFEHTGRRVGDLGFETQHPGAMAVPVALRLTRVDVVVRQRLDVVGARLGTLQRRDPRRHRHHLPNTDREMNALGVHPSVMNVGRCREMNEVRTLAASGAEQGGLIGCRVARLRDFAVGRTALVES